MFFARYGDIILGAILITFSVLMLALIVPEAVSVPKSVKVPALSPDFWIKIVVWILMLMGAAILWSGIKTARAEMADEKIKAVKEHMEETHSFGRSLLNAGTVIFLFWVYYHLINWLGMVAASILVVSALYALSGEKRFKIMVPLCILLPVALYYFFLKVAAIPMPLGIFE